MSYQEVCARVKDWAARNGLRCSEEVDPTSDFGDRPFLNVTADPYPQPSDGVVYARPTVATVHPDGTIHLIRHNWPHAPRPNVIVTVDELDRCCLEVWSIDSKGRKGG